MKVVALDYGLARTGVAVSDPTGTVARPLTVVERASSKRGLEELTEIVREHEPDRVVVGMPLTLRGERGAQAAETDEFVVALRSALDVPVETFDERFTSRLAERAADSGASSSAPEDARAAAHLLSTYLEWASRRS